MYERGANNSKVMCPIIMGEREEISEALTEKEEKMWKWREGEKSALTNGDGLSTRTMYTSGD